MVTRKIAGVFAGLALSVVGGLAGCSAAGDRVGVTGQGVTSTANPGPSNAWWAQIFASLCSQNFDVASFITRDQRLTETLPSRPISAYNWCIDVYLPNCIGAK